MKENFEDLRNSIVISLATCGGFVTYSGKRKHVNLSVSLPNKDKTSNEKESFKTFNITKEDLRIIEEEASELHVQISEMIAEEEAKQAEADKKKVEGRKKRDEERRIKARESRAKKKELNNTDIDQDKPDKDNGEESS